MTIDPVALQIANDSGFPLQLAVEHAVSESSRTHGWTVRYVEHSWTNRQDGQGGFIDLVLQNARETAFLVVECKRVRGSTWLFMHPDGEAQQRLHAKPWVTRNRDSVMRFFGWFDLPIDPPSPEALFCAVRGQSAADKNTMLERIGADIVVSDRGTRAGGWELSGPFPRLFSHLL